MNRPTRTTRHHYEHRPRSHPEHAPSGGGERSGAPLVRPNTRPSHSHEAAPSPSPSSDTAVSQADGEA